MISDFNRIDKDGDGMLNYNEVAFDAADANKDSQLSLGEYYNARASGNLSNMAGPISYSNQGMLSSNQIGFDAAGANIDSQLSLGQYQNATAIGDLGNMAGTTRYGNCAPCN